MDRLNAPHSYPFPSLHQMETHLRVSRGAHFSIQTYLPIPSTHLESLHALRKGVQTSPSSPRVSTGRSFSSYHSVLPFSLSLFIPRPCFVQMGLCDCEMVTFRPTIICGPLFVFIAALTWGVGKWMMSCSAF